MRLADVAIDLAAGSGRYAVAYRVSSSISAALVQAMVDGVLRSKPRARELYVAVVVYERQTERASPGATTPYDRFDTLHCTNAAKMKTNEGEGVFDEMEKSMT